jgi:ABC-2 type transport system ATP-binding protein
MNDAQPAPEPADGALELRDVCHAFGERRVLDHVDLTVPPGRVVGLLGPNGAGKSTLMRVMFGVLRPDHGEVMWRGRRASDGDRRSWGYMPQERGLYVDMRVHDQLVWIARLHGVERSTAERRATSLLERLGLGDRGHDTVKSLSGGMAQRVQLAASMVHEPQILVLDEPFAGLDPGAVDFLTEVLLDHVRCGGHLVFSSHQLDLVQDLCESITLIHEGRVVLEGDLRELRAASPDRFLRVDVAADSAWLNGDAAIESTTQSETRLRLRPGADALDVLDRLRVHAPVTDFGVESPSLSELFRAATGREAHGDGADEP